MKDTKTSGRAQPLRNEICVRTELSQVATVCGMVNVTHAQNETYIMKNIEWTEAPTLTFGFLLSVLFDAYSRYGNVFNINTI